MITKRPALQEMLKKSSSDFRKITPDKNLVLHKGTKNGKMLTI